MGEGVCGEEKNLKYITQYACGNHYECGECGHKICFANDNKEE